MVNTLDRPGTALRTVGRLIAAYVVVVTATIVVLLVVPASHSGHSGGHAWGHAVIVAVFAVLLPLRYVAARRGSGSARRALVVIALVLATVNVVEALLPGVFPGWMRAEMIAVALLMAAVAAAAVRTIRG